MFEIIVTIYVVSMCLTWTVGTLCYLFKVKKQLASPELATLNQNLRKVDMFWSMKNSNFHAWYEGALARDNRGMTRSFFMLVTVLSFLSMLGFILLNMILFVGYSRKEVRVFGSALATNPDLEAPQVKELVDSLGGV